MKGIIKGKKFDTDKLKLIYSDGHFSSEGVRVYATKSKKLIAVPWSQWQDSDPQPEFITVDDFLEYPHRWRVLKGLEQAEIELEEIE